MNKLKAKLGLFALLLLCLSCGSSKSETEAVASKTEVVDGISTSTFKVWGNCGMCKETIEKSLVAKGIQKADWDSETKVMKISYDSTQISLDEIHKLIAGVGYDTPKCKGNDTVYSGLHECCKYDRKK